MKTLIMGLLLLPWLKSGKAEAGVVGSPVNIGELGSTPIDTNSGPATDGTMRVILATDQQPIPVISTGNVMVSISSLTVTVATGSITAFQGGIWNFNAMPSTAPITVATGSITSFQGGPWSVKQSGSYTVTPGSGTWNVQFQLGEALPVIDTTTVNVLTDGEARVKVDTGTITAYQGGAWIVTALVSTAAVTVDTGSITAFQGGPWSVGQSGSYTVTPGSGNWTVQVISGQTLPVIDTTTVSILSTINSNLTNGNNLVKVETGTITAFQGGVWNVNATVSTSAVTVATGSITAFQGGSPWTFQSPSDQAIAVVSTTPITVNTHAVTQGSNPWKVEGGTFSIVNSTISVGQFGPWTTTVLQGTNPWNITGGTVSIVGSTISVSQFGNWTVSANQSGSYTVTPGSGTWNVNVVSSTNNPVVVATGSITSFQGGPWNVGQSGSYTVTPGSGTWTVFPPTGQALPVLDTTTVSNLVSILAGLSHVKVDTGTVTAYQGGSWSVSLAASTNPVTVTTGSITAFQGGSWSTSQSGSYTVTPGSGTWIVFPPTGQALPVVDTTTVAALSHVKLDTGTVTAFQGGLWSMSQSGSYTVTPGSGVWTIQAQSGQTIPVSDTTTVTALSHVKVDTGTITAFQGGTWNVNVVSSTNPVVVATGSITAFQGGAWSTSQSGSYTVTPGSGTWVVFPPTGQALPVVDTTTVAALSHVKIDTGTMTVFQGGLWSMSQSGSYTVTPGSGTWTVFPPTGQALPVVDTTTITDLGIINANITNGNARVKVDTGTITAFQGGGTWNVNLVSSGTQSNPLYTVMVTTSLPLPNLTPGVRLSTGIMIMDIKDTGRQVIISSAAAVTGVTTEALFTLQTSTAFTNATSTTSFGVTSGKIFRIQNFSCSWRTTGATAVGGECRLRVNSSGACTINSPMVAVIASNITSGGLAANASTSDHFTIPDGFELSGTQTFCISHLESTTSSNVDAILMGYQY